MVKFLLMYIYNCIDQVKLGLCNKQCCKYIINLLKANNRDGVKLPNIVAKKKKKFIALEELCDLHDSSYAAKTFCPAPYYAVWNHPF